MLIQSIERVEQQGAGACESPCRTDDTGYSSELFKGKLMMLELHSPHGAPLTYGLGSRSMDGLYGAAHTTVKLLDGCNAHPWGGSVEFRIRGATHRHSQPNRADD